MDIVRHELRRAGRLIRLQRRPCELLLLLIESQGEVVTREQISERLWSAGIHVDTEHNINTAIRKVRYALKDNVGRQRYIQTVVGKGYKFIGTVNLATEPPLSVRDSPPVSIETEAEPEALEIEQPKTAAMPPIETALVPVQTVAMTPPQNRRRRSVVWVIVAALIASALLAAVVIFLPKAPLVRPELAPVRSLVVLPFRNLSGDVEQDFVVDSLTDQLTANLGQFHSLRVISPNSAKQIRNTKDQLAQIRRALKVDAVVQGSEWYSQGRLRIGIQLLDTRSRRHLWAKNYEPRDTDAEAIRSVVLDDAIREISGTLRLGSRGDSGPGHTPNALAYNDYLRGRYFWNRRTLEGLEKSIGYYQQALKADPKFAQVYAALADSYVLFSSYGGPEPAHSLALARQNALRALQLNPKLGEAHTVLGAVKVDSDWNWEGAEEEYRMALRLNPEYPTAHHWYALHLSRLGRHAEAESQIKEALQLDPLSLIINTDAGEIFYRGGDMDNASKYLRKAIELDPAFADAHLVMGEVNERRLKLPQAIAEFRTAEELFHQAPNVVALEGHALALAGNRKSAIEIAQKLEALSAHRYVSGVDVALIYCALGDSDRTMAWLERAYKHRDKGLNILAADPLFANCRADRRFVDLLSKLRLPDLQLP